MKRYLDELVLKDLTTKMVVLTGPNTVRLAVQAELVEAHSPFDRLRANELKRTAL